MIDENKAQKAIDSHRAAAAAFPVVRRVIERFDGKVYNCRLEQALKSEIGESGSIYCRKEYDGSISIEYTPRGAYSWQCVGSIPLSADSKRIDARAVVEDMKDRRADHLKRAFDIEETERHIDEILQQIEGGKRALNRLIDSIPYEVLDAYGIRQTHYY